MSDFALPLASGAAPGTPAPTICHSPDGALALPDVYANAGIGVRVENGIEVSPAQSDDGGLRNSVSQLARRIREWIQASGLPQAKQAELIEFAVSQVRIQEEALPWPTAIDDSISAGSGSAFEEMEEIVRLVKAGSSREQSIRRFQQCLNSLVDQRCDIDEDNRMLVSRVNLARRGLGLGLSLTDGSRIILKCIVRKRRDGSPRANSVRFRAYAAASSSRILVERSTFPKLVLVDDLVS